MSFKAFVIKCRRGSVEISQFIIGFLEILAKKNNRICSQILCNSKFHNPIRVSGYTLLPMFRVFTPNQQFKMSSSVVESIKWRLLSTWFLFLIILSLKFCWFYSTMYKYGVILKGTVDKTGRAYGYFQLVNLCPLLSNTQVYKVPKRFEIAM